MPALLFEILAATLSAIAGGSVIELLAKALRDVSDLRRHMLAAREESFMAALQSADIRTLGGYLDSVMGDFTVRQYASNLEVSKRIDNYLDRLAEFLDADRDISAATPPSPTQDIPGDPDSRKVSQIVLSDYSWNVLAALRRDLERALRGLAEQSDLRVGQRIGPGTLLTALQRAGLLPDSAYSDLRYVVSVANRAIHGEDIPSDLIAEVLFLAKRGAHEAGIHLPQVPGGTSTS